MYTKPEGFQRAQCASVQGVAEVSLGTPRAENTCLGTCLLRGSCLLKLVSLREERPCSLLP